MAGQQLELQLLFYFYPIGLVVTLFGSQLASHWPRDNARIKPADEKDSTTGRVHATLTWSLQLLLTALIVRMSFRCIASMVPC